MNDRPSPVQARDCTCGRESNHGCPGCTGEGESSPPEFRPPYRYEVSEHGPVTIYDAVDVGWIARVKESLPHKEALAAAMVDGLNSAARGRPPRRKITFQWAYFPAGRARPHPREQSVTFDFSGSKRTWYCSQCGVEIPCGQDRWTAEACAFNLCRTCAENRS